MTKEEYDEEQADLFKKCLYCEKMTHDPHFVSACCGRGMCETCFQGLQGTEEQIQIDYMDDEDYIEKIQGTNIENKGDYVCFSCLDNKEKVYKIK